MTNNVLHSIIDPMAKKMMDAMGNVPASDVSVLLSCVLATRHVHHTHHWQTNGKTAYGDHLLFQRLYEDLDDEVDQIAERAVGDGSLIVVQPIMVTSHMGYFMQHIYEGFPVFPSSEEMVVLSLRAEYLTLALAEYLPTKGVLDESMHKTHLFLLQQRAGGVLKTGPNSET